MVVSWGLPILTSSANVMTKTVLLTVDQSSTTFSALWIDGGGWRGRGIGSAWAVGKHACACTPFAWAAGKWARRLHKWSAHAPPLFVQVGMCVHACPPLLWPSSEQLKAQRWATAKGLGDPCYRLWWNGENIVTWFMTARLMCDLKFSYQLAFVM